MRDVSDAEAQPLSVPPCGGSGVGSRRRRRARTWHVSPEGFRALRHTCFLSRQACASFLGVSVRTVRYWDSGRCRVPWSVVRILRLYRAGDLGGLNPAWSGWYLNSRTAELVTPNGYSFLPSVLEAWPRTCEQARFWRRDYDRRVLGGVGASAPARPEAVALQLGTGVAVSPVVPSSADRSEPVPGKPVLFVLPIASGSVTASVLAETGVVLSDSAMVLASSSLSLPVQAQGLPSLLGSNLVSICHQTDHFVTAMPTEIGPPSNTGLKDLDGSV